MKLKALGLFLVPVAAVVVACAPPGPASPDSSTTPHPAPTALVPSSAFTATPKPPTFAPLPTTTTPSGPQCHFRFSGGYQLPDPKCTPGAVQSTSVTAICTPGWASAHREYFTKKQREVAFAKYGVITSNPAGYGEYDHLIPLELGGSNSAANLWPEQGGIPNAKDPVENALHDAVCSGKVPLRLAQQAIASDWPTAGTKVIEVGKGLK